LPSYTVTVTKSLPAAVLSSENDKVTVVLDTTTAVHRMEE
jgi:hypothetical protein